MYLFAINLFFVAFFAFLHAQAGIKCKLCFSDMFCLTITEHLLTETVVQRFSVIKLPRPATLLKKRLWHRCFPVNFCEISKNTVFYRTPPVAASGIAFINLNFNRDHYQRFILPLQASNMPVRAGFEPALKLRTGIIDW